MKNKIKRFDNEKIRSARAKLVCDFYYLKGHIEGIKDKELLEKINMLQERIDYYFTLIHCKN